jgi:hypothetical protein
MIRVAIFDGTPGVKYVEFEVVPIERAAQVRCVPDGLLSFENAHAIAKEVNEGRVRGWIDHIRWYRQAGTQTNLG